MKSKFSSILGVGLALALVFTMALSVAPANVPGGASEAEAATLSWSTLNIPRLGNNQLIAAGADLGPVAPSPNFGTDQTVFAAVNLATLQTVYKSVDGGHTWVASSSAPLEVGGVNIVALVVSPQYASDSTVVAATQNSVFRSTDGGATFSELGTAPGAGTLDITSLDISPSYDGVGVIIIGLADTTGAATPPTGTEVRVWGYNGALNWTNFGLPTDEQMDVTSVRFSPRYAIDSTLLAVGSGNDTANLGTKLYTRVSDNAWDVTIGGPTVINAGINGTGNATAGILLSSIALPYSYDGTQPTLRRAYVNLTSSGGVAAGDDVYRITNVTAGVDMGLNLQLVNIDFAGDFATGTVIGGRYLNAADIAAGTTAANTYYTTNPTDSVVNWYGATNPLSGTIAAAGPTCYIRMDSDYLTSSTVFAGTLSTDSAFAVSRNGAVDWTETGLIDTTVPNLQSVVLSPSYATDSTIWLLTSENTGANDSVWRSENAGTYWERMHWMVLGANTGQLCLSAEYGTNGVVYVGDTGTVNVYYSGDKGGEWSAPSIPALRAVTIGSMAAPDATTVYVGDSAGGNVAKSINNGWGWTAANTKATGSTGNINSITVDGSVVLVGDSVGAVFKSPDAGTSWAQVGGAIAGATLMYVQMDGDTLYTADWTTGNIYRYVIGTSTAWNEIGAATTAPTGAVGLALAPDGTLYECDRSALATNLHVYRSIDPTSALPTPDAFFEAMTGLTAVTAATISVAPASLGNQVAIIEATTPSVQVYSDTLSLGTAGPVLVSPADGSVATMQTAAGVSQAIFQIDPIANVTIYDVWFCTDPTFAQITAGGQTTITAPSTITGANNLTEGYVTYWKARAQAGAPLRGAWSQQVWTVESQLTTTVNAPTPQSPGSWAGTTEDVPLEPVLNWSAFRNASGYEVQLALDADMTDFVADLTGADALGNVTSWKCTTTLEYDTTYYWRVRATMAGTTYSDWSNIVGFTTEAEEVIVEVEPVSTPAYIWGIIGVGALLVIAVLVLITRTRRVV